jgi:hypothetical protein
MVPGFIRAGVVARQAAFSSDPITRRVFTPVPGCRKKLPQRVRLYSETAPQALLCNKVTNATSAEARENAIAPGR